MTTATEPEQAKTDTEAAPPKAPILLITVIVLTPLLAVGALFWMVMADNKDTSAAWAQAPPPEQWHASDNPELLTRGATLYEQKCGNCHGLKREGRIGPTLDAKTWSKLSYSETFRIITDGVPNTSMQGWRSRLTPDEVQAITSFLYGREASKP